MKIFLKSIRFYFKYSWFNIKEQFSDLGSGIVGFLLFPFFIWLVARLWGRFNSYQGNYNFNEILLYVGATEILFMTFLRPPSLARASGDFSLSLARPRSWVAMSFSGLFGRCLGARTVFILLFLFIMPLLGVKLSLAFKVINRLFLLLPLLGVFQALVSLLFASAQVLWTETNYFILPVSKVFLALGGVFGPLVDFGEPWRTRLLFFPPADVFFQPAHFCVKGEFYRMNPGQWLTRVLIICTALGVLNFFFYRQARRYHQSFGG